MLLTRRARVSGFTIIELSVALTIAGILLALGAPAFSGYLQNARLGTMAQSMYSGLQTARAEAVKRNRNVEFVLTGSSFESSTADSITPDVAGRNWVVREKEPASSAYSLVEWKPSNGSEAGSVAIAASQATFSFDSLGSIGAGAGGIGIALTNPAMGACLPSGPVRCWNVVVRPGGQIRLCSPDTTLDASDSRRCPP